MLLRVSVNLWFSGGYLLNHSEEELRKKILIMNSKIDSLKIDISEPIEEIIFQDKNESG